jgi:hypothetical protein
VNSSERSERVVKYKGIHDRQLNQNLTCDSRECGNLVDRNLHHMVLGASLMATTQTVRMFHSMGMSCTRPNHEAHLKAALLGSEYPKPADLSFQT